MSVRDFDKAMASARAPVGVSPLKRKRSQRPGVEPRVLSLGRSLIEFELPIPTQSELNCGAGHHWSAQATRFKRQEKLFASGLLVLGIANDGQHYATGPIRVTLTRIGGGKMDSGDNVTSSLKHVKDCVAQWIRRDDADPLIVWDEPIQEPDTRACANIGVRVCVRRRRLTNRERVHAENQPQTGQRPRRAVRRAS